MEIFPAGTMEFFERICVLTGGRATGATLVMDSPGLLQDPSQATVVRDGTAHTAGNDVMVSPALYGLADSINYHFVGCPDEVIEMICPPDNSTDLPAGMAMLIMHELGHVTIHPAGESELYQRQGSSIPIPKGMQSKVMNILSDLLLNHNVMHAANITGTSDEDTLQWIRSTAIHGLAMLYLAPTCGSPSQGPREVERRITEHRSMVAAGTLPDTRYTPTEPCTAESDPDPDGNRFQCAVAAAGGVHDIGCFDNHFVDATDTSKVDNFSIPGPDTPPWQYNVGHGIAPQTYPTLGTACRYGLPDRFRRVRLGNSRDTSPYHDQIHVHNCLDCGNIWYRDDPVYTDVAMGTFDSPQPEFADGSICPGRVPWDSAWSCGSTNTATFAMNSGIDTLVVEAYTWDNRKSSQMGLFGMEPIWAVELAGTDPSITWTRGSAPRARINLSYLDHLCPDCGIPTGNMYGGAFRAWRRKDGDHIGLRQENQMRSRDEGGDALVAMPIYFQQLMMHQWAAIYATMRDIDDDLVLRNVNGNRLASGLASAKTFIKLFGIDCARDNRGV